jgi:hypothetical protein
MADADEKPNATQPQIKSMNGETVVKDVPFDLP